MSRNEIERFATLPDIDISRSRFNRDHSVTFTADSGECIPFLFEEILPGDTVDIKTNIVCRLQPLVAPLMGNLVLDTYYFFIPNRLLWSHWQEFYGQSDDNPWIQPNTYTVPQLRYPTNGFKQGTIADYLGLPIKVKPHDDNVTANALPFRAYAKVMQDWFRDVNNMPGVHLYTDDTTRVGSNGDDQTIDIELGGKPFIACKKHDFFTSCLRDSQRGEPVVVNTGIIAPVGMFGTSPDFTSGNGWFNKLPNANDSLWHLMTGRSISNDGQNPNVFVKTEGSPVDYAVNFNNTQPYPLMLGASGFKMGHSNTSTSMSSNEFPIFNTLSAYVQDFTGFTVNELRQSFAIQKFLEKSARAGNRYIDFLKAMFGVDSPDARLQRSEYLGGSSIPVNVAQVTNTTAGNNDNVPLGDVAGQSVTFSSDSDVFKSFTEHGILLGICVMRIDKHIYSYGQPREFNRKTMLDYYLPVFANLSEQNILNSEIFLDSAIDSKNNETFGYQERWAEYRYKNSRVCGEMRPNADRSLAVWNLADKYSATPTLTADWIREDKTILDRCLAVTSDVSNQYFADFYIENTMTRPLPFYSIPGLIDHH